MKIKKGHKKMGGMKMLKRNRLEEKKFENAKDHLFEKHSKVVMELMRF
jgi:hypothetical protein